jgi:hypothetical protein
MLYPFVLQQAKPVYRVERLAKITSASQETNYK